MQAAITGCQKQRGGESLARTRVGDPARPGPQALRLASEFAHRSYEIPCSCLSRRESTNRRPRGTEGEREGGEPHRGSRGPPVLPPSRQAIPTPPCGPLREAPQRPPGGTNGPRKARLLLPGQDNPPPTADQAGTLPEALLQCSARGGILSPPSGRKASPEPRTGLPRAPTAPRCRPRGKDGLGLGRQKSSLPAARQVRQPAPRPPRARPLRRARPAPRGPSTPDARRPARAPAPPPTGAPRPEA